MEEKPAFQLHGGRNEHRNTCICALVFFTAPDEIDQFFLKKAEEKLTFNER